MTLCLAFVHILAHFFTDCQPPLTYCYLYTYGLAPIRVGDFLQVVRRFVTRIGGPIRHLIRVADSG